MVEKKNERNKQRYDQWARFCPLASGDRVLIRNLGLQGKHKLADHWKDSPDVVESQLPGLPVFKLKPESGHGPGKVLHCNHILPIGQEVQLQSEKNKETPRPKRKASKWLKARRTENCLPAPEQDDKRESASDSEEDEMGVWYDYHPL